MSEDQRSETKQELKINCECGSIVLKKNLSSHSKTKKHLAVVGSVPPLPSRESRAFSKAQKTTVADVDELEQEDEEDDEYDEDGHDGDDADDEFEEEVLGMLEGLAEHIIAISNKLDACFERIEETRLKVNLCLGEVRELSLKSTPQQAPLPNA